MHRIITLLLAATLFATGASASGDTPGLLKKFFADYTALREGRLTPAQARTLVYDRIDPGVIEQDARETACYGTPLIARFGSARKDELATGLSVYPEGDDWYTVILEGAVPADPVKVYAPDREGKQLWIAYIMPRRYGPLFGKEYLPRHDTPEPVRDDSPEAFVHSFYENYLAPFLSNAAGVDGTLAALRETFTEGLPAPEPGGDDPVILAPAADPSEAASLRTLQLTDDTVAVSLVRTCFDRDARRRSSALRTLLVSIRRDGEGRYAITRVSPFTPATGEPAGARQ